MDIIGIGGAHIDRRGQVSGDYIPAASNPGTMREDIGGGALNALRNAVQLGLTCTMMSIRGGDAAGDQVARAIANSGIIDMSATFLDRATPTYTALIDRHGELVTGFADMGLYDIAFPKQLRRSSVREAIAAHRAVLCDANIPQAGVERLVELAADKPIYAIGVSPVKVMRLQIVLPRLACLFINRTEAAALTGQMGGTTSEMVDGLRALGLQAGVITAGQDALALFDGESTQILQPPAPACVRDVTGAGDALAGATVAALLKGMQLADALREGVAASLLTIENTQAVGRLDHEAFAAKLALVPEARRIV